MSIIKATGAGDPASTGFYTHTIDQSLRFNDGDSSYLTFTPSSATAGTWTISFWVKRGVVSTTQYIYYSGAISARGGFYFLSDDRFGVSPFNSSGANANLFSIPVFRDPAQWYHIVMTASGITPSNLSSNLNIYVNGVEISHTKTQLSSPTGGDRINDAQAKRINGLTPSGGQHFDGYLAEWHWIDGTVYDQNTFGEFRDNIWTAKEVTGISYGAAGYYLNFADSSDIGNNALTTDGTNDWTPNGVVASDITSDSPTRNFATLMPMPNIALSEANLKMTTTRTGNWDGTIGSFGVTSGKWYYEVRPTVTTDSTFRCVAGWQGNQASQTVTYSGKGASGSPYGTLFDNYLVSVFTTSFYKDGGTDGTMTAPSSGDVINVAADFDNGKIYFGINGTYYANDGGTDGNPGAGTNESMSGIDLTASEYVPAFHIRSDNATGGNQMIVNFGQEGTFAGTETAGGYSDANGVGNFFNAVPSGFLALASSNLTITIGPGQDSQANEHFDTVLYTGNGSSSKRTDISYDSLIPDLVWVKQRSSTQDNALHDTVRGSNKKLESNNSDAEVSGSGFGTDGLGGASNNGTTELRVFTADAQYNANSATYVAWGWKAGGTAVSNTDGTITSSVSANTDAGFSIISWTGAGADGTIGHGLTQTPEFFITKDRNNTRNWEGFHKDITAGYVLYLNLTNAQNNAGNTYFQGGFSASDTNNTTIALSSYLAQTGRPMIGYAFHSVEGYSKVSSFHGNNANYPNGMFVLTNFRPALVVVKAYGTTGDWVVTDNKRASSFNGDTARLYWSGNGAETAFASNRHIELLSNGFKVHGNSASSASNRINENASYIYLAFAEAPLAFANAR